MFTNSENELRIPDNTEANRILKTIECLDALLYGCQESLIPILTKAIKDSYEQYYKYSAPKRYEDSQ